MYCTKYGKEMVGAGTTARIHRRDHYQFAGAQVVKKLLGILVFSILSGSALAEWTEVPFNGADRLFVDKSTIEWSGKVVRMLWLIDLTQPTPSMHKGRIQYYYSSKKFLAEYGCSNDNIRIVYLSLHTGHMGSGAEYKSSSSQGWRDIKDGYHQEWHLTQKIACSSTRR